MRFEILLGGSIPLSLPVCPLPAGQKAIIAFDSMGDMPLVQLCAQLLFEKLPRFEAIICPEAKAVPIAQELCRMAGVSYFCLRKAKKLYMQEPKAIELRSITTEAVQHLWFDAKVMETLQSKKVLLFDDVVSTGATFGVLEKVAAEFSLNLAGKACVFLEGEAEKRSDIVNLGYLPLLDL